MALLELIKEQQWKDVLFNNNLEPKRVNDFKRFLDSYNNIYLDNLVRLYHGTSIEHNVLEEGLLPTSNKRKKSMQSTNGYVYLSIYPSMAKTFGEIAYPNKEIIVYSVDIHIRYLKADLDQLRNKRHWANIVVGNSLAESIIFGHGARVKGKIEPYKIKKCNLVINKSCA